MSGLLVICRRDPGRAHRTPPDGEWLLDGLSPDNITSREPLRVDIAGVGVTVLNPVPDLTVSAGAVCLGAMLEPDGAWSRPGAPRPDGTYLLCRADAGRVELVTDLFASRTAWYVLTDDLFLASTSQRALVRILGSFQLNPQAVSWMASSGTLGLGNAWDERLAPVPAATRLTLDRGSWRLSQASDTLELRPPALSDDAHIARLREAILETCTRLDLPPSRWVLPLSGGLDSRTLLAAFLRAGVRYRCVTWSTAAAASDPRSDAGVAARIARAAGVEHELLPADLSDEPLRDVLTRYIVAGEGRTEEIAGYADGLGVWRRLFEDGVGGIIRGDEPGWGYYSEHPSPSVARHRCRCVLAHEYPDGHLVRRLGLEPQSLPPSLTELPGEDPVDYQSRVFQRFEMLVGLAPLNDLKCAYVDVVNPFMTERVTRVAHELPGKLRRGRRAFRDVATSLMPGVPEAARGALPDANALLQGHRLRDEVVAELRSPAAERILDRAALDAVVAALLRPAATRPQSPLGKAVRAAVPKRVRRLVRPERLPALGAGRLGLRLYLASRMTSLLTEDAARGSAP